MRNELRPLYEDLRHNAHRVGLALEQERIGFVWVNIELEKAGLK